MRENSFTAPQAVIAPRPTLGRIPDTNPAGCSFPVGPCLSGSLLEALPAPAFLLSPTLTFVACNTPFCKLVGLPRPSVVGADVFKVLPHDKAAKIHESITELLDTGGVRISDEELDHADGTTHQVVLNMSAVRANAGDIAGIAGLIMDVTDRHRAVEAQGALVAISDASHHADGLHELILYIHAALSPLVQIENFGVALLEPGAPAPAFPYWVDERICEPREDAAIVDLVTMVVRENRDVRMVSASGVDPAASAMRESAGAATTVGVPLVLGETAIGSLIARTYAPNPGLDENAITFLRFVSGQIATAIERLRGKTTLRESEERYRSLFQTLHSALVVCDVHYDRDGTPETFGVTATNPAFGELIGDSPAVGFGQSFIASMLNQEPEIRELFQDVAGDRQVRTAERFSPTLAKHLRLVVFSPKPGQVAALVDDVSARVRAEQEAAYKDEELGRAQRMQMLGQLAAGLAHTLNSSMQAVVANLAGVKTACAENGDVQHKIAQIECEVDRQAVVVRQLLVLGQRDITRPERFDLSDAVRPALDHVPGRDLARVFTVLELARGPLSVHADRSQLQQLIINLTVNALEAMPDGGELHIRTGRRDDTTAFLEVQDDGCGIPDDLRDRLFELFLTTKTDNPSRGLGLAIAHSIANSHGGTIELESEVGSGSIFRVLLPLNEVAEPQTELLDDNESPDVVRTAKTRVLLVEDNDGAREGLHAVLDVLGYSVAEAASAEEAFECAKSRSFDLLLTDLMLPGLSGSEAAAQLQREQPSLRVVLMSGHTDEDGTKASIRNGSTHFLQKPFGIETLAQELSAAMGEREARHA
jgi:PAS domain S-box-containing protein